MLTNSLASTDEPVVHLGYSRHRVEMLKMGINLYELSSTRLMKNKRMFLFGESLGRLHAKLVVIDHKTIFIGSMNLDPRSATINTELGAVIDSPSLAGALADAFETVIPLRAWQLSLGANGAGLVWTARDPDGGERRFTTEPDTSLPRRLGVDLLSLLPIDGLL